MELVIDARSVGLFRQLLCRFPVPGRALPQRPCFHVVGLCAFLPQPDLLTQAASDQAGYLLRQGVLNRQQVPGRLLEAGPLEIRTASSVNQPEAHP